MHNFRESLRVAEEQTNNPMWRQVYSDAFPTLQSMDSISQDGWAQRGGIDRLLTLSSGKVISVDEKVRTVDYGDILLEYWSSFESKTRGWIAKDLACDYIAYAIIPSNKCYMLPFQQLRKAWRENGKDWVKRYKRIEADNGSYTTVSVAVPIQQLIASINTAMIAVWKD